MLQVHNFCDFSISNVSIIKLVSKQMWINLGCTIMLLVRRDMNADIILSQKKFCKK